LQKSGSAAAARQWAQLDLAAHHRDAMAGDVEGNLARRLEDAHPRRVERGLPSKRSRVKTSTVT
jgi:hypothetical protein